MCFLDGQKPFSQVYRGSLTEPLTLALTVPLQLPLNPSTATPNPSTTLQLPLNQVYRGSLHGFTVSGLQAEQKVVLRLRAYNRAGAGPWSDELTLQVSRGVGLGLGFGLGLGLGRG